MIGSFVVFISFFRDAAYLLVFVCFFVWTHWCASKREVGAAGLLAVLFGDGVTVLRTEGALVVSSGTA